MEKQLGKAIPKELGSLYHQFNGISFYHSAINLFGSTTGIKYDDDNRYPFPLVNGNHPLKTPPETTSEILYIGTCGMDASLIYHNAVDGTVHRTSRKKLLPLASWGSIDQWIEMEIKRLDAIAERSQPFEMIGPDHLPMGKYS
ncbi:MAG: hypothetical protein KA408_03155 [Flavobacteriales bacterium]|nr:hypothetical protein [Flavobacteriales bacterium]